MGGAENAAKWRNEEMVAGAARVALNAAQVDKRDRSPVEASMARISTAVSNLDSALSALEDRVSPVMSGSVPTAGPDGERLVVKGQSIMFDQLESLARRIEELASRIRDDIQRVEL